MFKTVRNALAGVLRLATTEAVLDRTTGAIHYRDGDGAVQISRLGERVLLAELGSSAVFNVRRNTTGVAMANGTATIASPGVYEIAVPAGFGELLFGVAGNGDTGISGLPAGWSARVQSVYTHPAGYVTLRVSVFNGTTPTSLSGAQGVLLRLQF